MNIEQHVPKLETCQKLQEAEVRSYLVQIGLQYNDAEVWSYAYPYIGSGYLVSSFGRIISLPRKGNFNKGRLMKTSVTKHGYEAFRFHDSRTNKAATIPVHRLVLKTFIGDKPKRNQVNHKDGNKLNNRLENLEWCTASENNLHAYAMGLKDVNGIKNSHAKLTDREVQFIRYMVAKYPYIEPIRIAEFYGMSNTAINDILNFKKWTHI